MDGHPANILSDRSPAIHHLLHHTEVDVGFDGIVQTIRHSEHSRIFVFDDWMSRQNFFKQFFSGIFIVSS